MRSILVTGIGGVVGQGVLRNLRAMNLMERIIGTNSSRVTPANHLCDEVYEVPLAVDPDYISSINKIILRNDVQLIIPSTDYEAHFLSLNSADLMCNAAVSASNVTKLCLDKYVNFVEFKKREIPFARSFLPSEYTNEFEHIIVKPREGRGSRQIMLDPPDLERFDDSYVIQEFLDGPELTVAFYVRKSGDLHGFIALERQLANGSTVQCEVTRQYDEQINQLVEKIVANFRFTGSANVQCRVTEKGPIPFEINCRISGTNSIRSQFGFKDVAYTVQEFLFNQSPELPNITIGCAMRMAYDVIYPNIRLSEVTNSHDQFWVF